MPPPRRKARATAVRLLAGGLAVAGLLYLALAHWTGRLQAPPATAGRPKIDPVAALPRLAGLPLRAGPRCGWQTGLPVLCQLGQYCDTRVGRCTAGQPASGVYPAAMEEGRERCGGWCVPAEAGGELLEAALVAHLEEQLPARADLPWPAQLVQRGGSSCGRRDQVFRLCAPSQVCDLWTEKCVDAQQARCAPIEWGCFVAVSGADELEVWLVYHITARMASLRHKAQLKSLKQSKLGACGEGTASVPGIKTPTLLWWNNCDMHDPGQTEHNFPKPAPVSESCPTPCLVTDNLGLLSDADAVIIRVDYCMLGSAGLNAEELRLGAALPPHRKPGQVWMAYSSENPYNYPQMADAAYMQHFNFSSFQSLDSDYPIAYAANIRLDGNGMSQVGVIGSGLALQWTELEQPVPFEEKTGLASYIYSNCDTPSRRDAYTRELMKHLQVDSFGRCLHNREWPSGVRDQGMYDPNREANKDAVMRNYKFELTFQNARCDDEVDEKMLQAMRRGVVPVYLGAPNIHRLQFPKFSFIHAGDYETPKHLADYLLKVANDKQLYEKYLGWRPSFQGMLPPFTHDFMKRPTLECWLCAKLYRGLSKPACAKPDLSCHKINPLESTHHESPID